MMNYEKGLVSVVMPTYKRSEKLIRAVSSVLSQTYENLELLLINDNNPDDDYTRTLKVRVKEFESDPRFHLIIQDKHINGAVARNVGIKQARGEFIAFLDDDDWWKKDKIEKQVNQLESLSDEWGVVSCRIAQYDNDKLIAQLPMYRNGNVYKDVFMQQCDFATGTLLFRHTALDETGCFDPTLLRNQDWQLLINCTYRYKLFQIDECLHCCDVSDVQNRPNGDKAVEYKKLFFRSVDPIFQTMTKKEQKCTICITNFELGYIYIKGGKYLKGLKYSMRALSSPMAVKLIAKKFKMKIAEKKVNINE